MSVQLERATPALVQTFARGCPESDEELARAVGFTGVLDACLDMVSRSRDVKALVQGREVLALAGVYANQKPANMWVHTAPSFKTAGFGALRVSRLLVDRWVLELGELGLAVPMDNPDLARMADWLGFRVCGPVVSYGGRQFFSTTRKAA